MGNSDKADWNAIEASLSAAFRFPGGTEPWDKGMASSEHDPSFGKDP
jgi:hypothetical protein